MPILWALVIEVPLYIKVKTFTQWKRKQIDRYYYEQNVAGEVSLSDHMSNFYYKLNWITTGLICSIQISHFLSFTFTLYPEYKKEEIINNFPFPFFHIYSLSWIHKKRLYFHCIMPFSIYLIIVITNINYSTQKKMEKKNKKCSIKEDILYVWKPNNKRNLGIQV